MEVLPLTEELPLELFPEPLLLVASPPELLLPLEPSPAPPLPVVPSPADEKDPQEVTMTPSDTTSDTDARFRIFFMATSPIVNGPEMGMG